MERILRDCKMFVIIISIFIVPLSSYSQYQSNNRMIVYDTVYNDSVSIIQLRNKQYITEIKFINGRVKLVKNMKDGQLDGLVTLFYSGGGIFSQLSYKEGVKNGSVKVFSIYGNLKLSGICNNGECIDTTYSDNGKITEVRHSKDDRTTYVARYCENGQLIVEEFQDTIFAYKEFFCNGSLKVLATKKYYGGFIGPYIEYYDNGHVKFKGKYQNDYSDSWGSCRVGRWEFYKPDGSLWYEEEYEDCKLLDQKFYKDVPEWYNN